MHTLSVNKEKNSCGHPPVKAKATLDAVVFPHPTPPTLTTIGLAPTAFCHLGEMERRQMVSVMYIYKIVEFIVEDEFHLIDFRKII